LTTTLYLLHRLLTVSVRAEPEAVVGKTRGKEGGEYLSNRLLDYAVGDNPLPVSGSCLGGEFV